MGAHFGLSRLKVVGGGMQQQPPPLRSGIRTLTEPTGEDLHRRFRGVSSVSTPANREIGFVSSSFSFRVVRASGRGEAVRARVRRYSPRWASWELVSTWWDTFR